MRTTGKPRSAAASAASRAVRAWRAGTVGTPAAARMSRAASSLTRAGGEGRGGRDGRPRPPLPEGPREAREGRDRARRVRRLLVDRDPRRLQIPGVVRGAEPGHREVFVGVRALPRDPGGAGRLHQGRVPSDRALEADEAPVVAVRRRELDEPVEKARVVQELAGHVDGVPRRRERDELEHPALRGLRHLRDGEPAAVRVVRHQHPDPARDGDHRHPVVGGKGPDDRASRDVEELLDALRPVDPELAEQRVVDRVLAGEGRGVGGGGGRARLGAPELDRDDRGLGRPRPLQGGEELRPVPAPFHVEEDRLRRLVLGEERGAVPDVDVRLVAGGEHVAQGMPALAGEHVGEPPERPALAHEPDLSRDHLVGERGVERGDRPAPEVRHAHAVGAHEADAGLAGEARHRGLRVPLAHLREPGGEDDEGADLLLRALGEHAHDGGGGDGADREVDGARDVLDARERGETLDRVPARVDGVDRALEAVLDEGRDRPAPDLGGGGGGAEHRDRARAEEGLEGGEVDVGGGGGGR